MKFNYKHIDPVLLKSDWQTLAKEINGLPIAKLDSVESLELFIERVNEFDVLINEIEGRYFIRSLQNSKNKELSSTKEEFQSLIVAPFKKIRKASDANILNNSYFISLVNEQPIFEVLYKKLKHENDLKEKDVSEIDKRIRSKVNEYDTLLSEMTMTIDGKKKPLVFALGSILKNPDREERKEGYKKVQEIKDQHVNKIDEIYDSLIALHTQKSTELGFPNFRDFKWYENNKTYTPKETADLCESIKEVFIPIQKQMNNWRKELLDLDRLMPWDRTIDLFPKSKTKYFEDIDDLKAKVYRVYQKIHPDFADFFNVLEQHEHLDLDVRENKSPAWFTYNFPETGVPFVYLMSENTSIQGITIIFHETTHAIHHLYNVDKRMLWLKHPDTEAAELFTMTMELITMEYWDEFFEDPTDLAAAKLEKINNCLEWFKVVALWDRFQTWAYLNPKHTHKERNEYWLHLLREYDVGITETDSISTSWQDRPLIFRAPFYLIEYAIAILGALVIYKDFKINKQKVIERLIKAMKLGNTATIQEIYKTAGVDFDFTKDKVKEVGIFLTEEWNSLKLELEHK